MNVEKYALTACGHLFAHYERARDEQDNYIRFGNRDIDTSRTALNFNLAPDRGMTQSAYLEQRLSEVYHIKKKDLNVMCSWVITVPDDLPEEKHLDFFVSAYRFMSERYGEDNVLSAFVHLDENMKKGHAHMHFAFVPVVYDKKKERFKVSAKDVLNKNELKTIHKDIEQYLSKALDCPVHMLNGKTIEGNRTIKELKECKDKITEANEIVRALSEKADRLQTHITEQSNELKEIREERERMMPVYAEGVEMPEVKRKKTLLGAETVEMKAAEWEKCADMLLDMSGTLEIACERVKTAEQEAAALKEKAKRQKKQETELKQLQADNLSLQKRLLELQERIERFLRMLLQALPELQEVIKRCAQHSFEEREQKRERERTR